MDVFLFWKVGLFPNHRAILSLNVRDPNLFILQSHWSAFLVFVMVNVEGFCAFMLSIFVIQCHINCESLSLDLSSRFV